MKYLLACFLIVSLIGSTFAQKFGYIDSEYILSKMPEYQEAKTNAEKLAKGWQQEILQLQQEIDNMYSQLKAEEVLLTDDLYQERLSEIQVKEDELKAYQNKIFGVDGMFYLKKKELIKPIQDKVFEAVEKVCKVQRIEIMFDKASELIMIYTNPRHDYSDFVLEELGLGDPNESIK